ncbi:hypothetical protein [Acrocarpospora catenulata]|uniref:hypothetical protein n=1 Tax=Acrocarpospora catenulata TaxID=2836182 RepID=UPI001BDAA7A5|nr:hypothetical protein [Acrocarpospora catenulata]
MTQRSEFDDIRAHLAAEAAHAGDLLRIARELLDDLEQVRMREATLRTYYLALLTASRASVAAQQTGAENPLLFVIHELAKHGQLPSGEEVGRILSDAKAAQELLAAIGETPVPPRRRGGPASSRLRRCVGISRSLPH